MKKFFTMLMGILISISSFAALPNKVYAPYVDVMLWPTFSLMNCYNATGQKYYTLAFITAGSNGQPAWGGVTPMDQNFMLDQINQLRAVGGDVIISFGGANGTPIDAAITDVNALVNAYQSVINRYGLTWIDFDVEGFWVADQASIDRRNQAARILQQNNPGLKITYCLPVMPTGLTWDGTNVINKAKAAGVNIYNVNIMAMDYGQSNSQMGQAAISAAQNARSQTQLNIGITPMIGKNDTQNETFTLANATEVLNFANATSWVNMIAMWSCNRDNGGCPGQTFASPTCSGLSQANFAFVNTWKSFSGTGGCNPIAINPYISVNGGAWQNTSSASLAVGGTVTMGPQPTDGTWRWTGPNGFSSTSRQITISNIQTTQGGNYVASYTNPCGATSTRTFSITVTGGTGVATVYQDCNYGGAAVALPLGDYNLSAMISRGIGNDWISSLRVTSGYRVTLYEHDNYTGVSLVVTADNSCLVGAGWNDRASSMRVATNGGSFSTTIQAENWLSMSGVQTEACSEGGLNVGWIDTGDWMAYNVTIPTTGTYRVIYRVASPNSSRTLRLEKDNGTTQLGTVTLPNTGGWQNWQNVAHNVTLPAGTYSIGIATATGGFNINYFTITNNLSARISTHEEEVTPEGESAFVLSPNPFIDQLFIKNPEKVKRIKIYNIQGMETISVENPGKSISVESLKPGLHIAVIEHLDMSIRKEKVLKE